MDPQSPEMQWNSEGDQPAGMGVEKGGESGGRHAATFPAAPGLLSLVLAAPTALCPEGIFFSPNHGTWHQMTMKPPQTGQPLKSCSTSESPNNILMTSRSVSLNCGTSTHGNTKFHFKNITSAY